ncbi:SH2 domain-containing protein [Baffinella frigidus]|nr:SH2 domain-containing protein [Cryptophyta sp. CCMP2293]
MIDQERFACSRLISDHGDDLVEYENEQMSRSERADKARQGLIDSITNVLCFMRGVEHEDAKHTVDELRNTLREVIDTDWPEELQNAAIRPMLDVPFIARYRQEYWKPVMSADDLWRVFDLDGKYSALRVRKRHLAGLFDARADHDGIALVKEAQSEEALADLNALHEIRYPAGQDVDEEEDKKRKGHRRPVKISKYKLCQDAKLDTLLRRFAITPKELAENLAGAKRHTPVDLHEDPDTVAVDYVPGASLQGFREASTVLKALVWMGAKELASEPAIRRMVRERHFAQRAVVSCTCTRKGHDSAETQHLMFQYMLNHDHHDIEDEDVLRIMHARDEGLLKVKVSLREKDHERCVNDLSEQYVSDMHNETADAWNKLRREILETALSEMLYPSFELELLNQRARVAKSQVARGVQRELESRLRVAPYFYRDPPEGQDSKVVKPRRIMALCFGEPTECVVIDEWGEVIDYLSIALFVPSTSKGELRQTDRQKLEDFILKENPEVLVVGGSGGLKIRVLKDKLEGLMSELLHLGKIERAIDILLADQSVAYKYALSPRAPTEFPRYPPLRLQAVSLARRLQDPLREMAGMCAGRSDDVLSLHLHPLQDMLDRTERLKFLHRAFVNVVNENGVDINLAADRQNIYSHTVQFVAGLGPRKAQELLKIICQKGCVQYREQLMLDEDVRRVMREVVWTNCAAFLKITRNTSMWAESIDIGEYMDDDGKIHIKGGGPMERSRIHPEVYSFAMKMTSDALEEDNCMETVKRGMHESIHADLCKKLDDLDLDFYAGQLEDSGFGKRKYTLKDIRAELQDAFPDVRPQRGTDQRGGLLPWELSKREEFNLILGESDRPGPAGPQGQPTVISTLIDQVAHVKVRKIIYSKPREHEAPDAYGAPFKVILQMENGLQGELMAEEFADQERPEDAQKFMALLHEDQVLSCVIIRVDVEDFKVILSARASLLARVERTVAKKEEKKKIAYAKRNIHHPMFKNFSRAATIKKLEEGDVGDYIIRPSKAGTAFLNVTRKVHEGVYHDAQVVMEGQPNSLAIGKVLKVDDMAFEDLDELAIGYVEPLATNDKKLIEHEKFFQGPSEEIKTKLVALKQAAGGKGTPYMFGFNFAEPGKFILFWLPGMATVREESVRSVPLGYRFRKQVFASPNRLINYFKQHAMDEDQACRVPQQQGRPGMGPPGYMPPPGGPPGPPRGPPPSTWGPGPPQHGGWGAGGPPMPPPAAAAGGWGQGAGGGWGTAPVGGGGGGGGHCPGWGGGGVRGATAAVEGVKGRG